MSHFSRPSISWQGSENINNRERVRKFSIASLAKRSKQEDVGRLPTSGRQRAVLRTETTFMPPVGSRRRNRPEVDCLPLFANCCRNNCTNYHIPPFERIKNVTVSTCTGTTVAKQYTFCKIMHRLLQNNALKLCNPNTLFENASGQVFEFVAFCTKFEKFRKLA